MDGQDHVLSQANALTKNYEKNVLFSQSVSLTQYVVLSVCLSAFLSVRVSLLRSVQVLYKHVMEGWGVRPEMLILLMW